MTLRPGEHGQAGNPSNLSSLVSALRTVFADRSGGVALVAFAVRVVGAAIAYGMQILLARWLGLADYGVFVVVYVWITILSQIGNLGFSSSAVRFVAQYRATGDGPSLGGFLIVSRAAAVAFASGLAALGVGALFALPGLVDPAVRLPVLLGALTLPLFCLTEVQDGIARAFDWPDLAFGPTYIWRPLLVIALVAAVALSGEPVTAVTACLATLLATWATAALQTWLIGRRSAPETLGSGRRFATGHWLKVSLPILLADGFYVLLTSIDLVLMSWFEGPGQAAIYYAAVKTLAMVHFVYYAVRAATGPRFSALFHSGRQQDLRNLLARSAVWTFWPSVVLTIAVLLAGRLLLGLFGADFTEGLPVLLILSAGILARASVGTAETLLTMAGHQTAVAMIFGTAFACNAIACFMLIPPFGLLGAASATALSLGLEAVLTARAVRRHFGAGAWIFSVSRSADRGSATP